MKKKEWRLMIYTQMKPRGVVRMWQYPPFSQDVCSIMHEASAGFLYATYTLLYMHNLSGVFVLVLAQVALCTYVCIRLTIGPAPVDVDMSPL